MMLLQVIEAGWLYEVVAPDRSRLEGAGSGEPVLVLPDGDTLAPCAVVRAAKDRMLDLCCGRAWRLEAARAAMLPQPFIREVAPTA